MTRKTIFKDVEIIQLPFKPFREAANLEKELLNEISSSIIKIERSVRRKVGVYKQSIEFNFRHCETIIAIDLMALYDWEISYLEILKHIINLFPVFLINSAFTRSNLMNMALHKQLRRSYYILPIFPVLSPFDSLSSVQRYGSNFYKLLGGGEMTELFLENLIDNKCNKEDFLKRFAGLYTDNTIFKYRLDIFWLGIDDYNIEQFLIDCFNNNYGNFNISYECNKYEIDPIEMNRYIDNSMLFDRIDKDNCCMRMQRANIIPIIKNRLAQMFESKLYDSDAIDTTATDFSDFKGNFVEYHDVSRIFNPDDTYSVNLIVYSKKLLDKHQIDRIYVTEYGSSRNLAILINKIFGKPVTRLLCYDGVPNIYPLEEYLPNE